MRTVFILSNDELGFNWECPVYATEKEASDAAACKARQHSVLEVPDHYQPCRPHKVGSTCLGCAIYLKNK